MACLGPAVWRAIPKLRTRQEVARLVQFVRARLDERPGLGLDFPSTRRWAEWCVREALRTIEEEREEREKSEVFLAQLRREAEEARRQWSEVNEKPSVSLSGTLERRKRLDFFPSDLGEDDELWSRRLAVLRLPQAPSIPETPSLLARTDELPPPLHGEDVERKNRLAFLASVQERLRDAQAEQFFPVKALGVTTPKLAPLQ